MEEEEENDENLLENLFENKIEVNEDNEYLLEDINDINNINNNIIDNNNEEEEEDNQSYRIGDLVMVMPRLWPGINKPGGVARITKINKDGK